MTDYAYDVFLSYSSRDADWVRTELLPKLQRHGLSVWDGERDFELGAPSVAEMERAVTISQRVLLVLTPDYLRSAGAEFARYMLQTLDPAARERRLIPLLHTPCELPPSLGYLHPLDFTVTQDWNQLLNAFPSPLSGKTLNDMPLNAVPDPATLPPGSLMPLSRNPLFVGRQRELRHLARLLKGGATAAINPVAATTGLGGIGKTQLASEFAHRYGQYFPGGVFWLSFENADAVPAEIARCGGAGYLGLQANFSSLPQDEQIQLVLQAWQLDRPRLLVFDNCEDEALLDRWRPKTGGCRVLVTSRRAEWAATLGVQPLRLETLPRMESIALLRKYLPDLSPDDADLDALAVYLGDLPLALHVAGSFLKLYEASYSPADYLAELQAAGGVDEELLMAEDGFATGHDQSVIGTFRVSYDKLDASNKTDELALRLLARAAHCAPGELLPRWLLIATASIDPNDKKATRPATKAIKRLSDLGLVEIEEAETLRLHRLLAAFVRVVSTDDEAQSDVEQRLLSIANYLNSEGDPRPLLAFQPQLRAVTDMARERFDERGTRLCNELGYHLQMIGDYPGARPYYERALAINEQVLGAEHPDTALSLSNLGYLLQAQGDLAGARPYFERALAINEQVLGAKHPDTATSLNNLGALLYAQRDLVGAQPYLERALAISEQVLGAKHPDTAGSLNNLGTLLQAQGDLAGAQPYYERALAIKEQVLGAEHPDTARSLNNLGYLLRAQGDLAGAQPYYEQALAIREQVLGAEHPDTARSLNNLGTLLQAQGDLAGAQPYYERALAILEQALGANHLDTVTSLNNLGTLLHAQGDYGGAKPYYKRTLAILEQTLGPNHPNTQAVRDNLAALDTTPQSDEQQIADVERQAIAAVEVVLAKGEAEQRAALATAIEEAAQRAEQDEAEGSPYLALAGRLRELAARLDATE